MKSFELLKRTYPVSQFNRNCDGWSYIDNHSTIKERKEWGVDLNKLQRTIVIDEKYIYQVAKEGVEFKIMTMCFSNYAIIRKHIFGIDD